MFEDLLDDLKDPWDVADFENWVKTNNNIVKRMHAQTAGTIFLVITGLIDLAYLIVGRQNKWLSAGMVLCFVVFLLLPVCFPAYYSLKPRRYGVYGETPVRFRLGVWLFFHMLIMVRRTMADFCFASWADAFLFALAAGFLITGIMLLLAKEFRVKDRVWLGFLGLMLLLGIGIVGQMNYLLDPGPMQTSYCEITDVDLNAGRSRDILRDFFQYECTLELSDGTKATFSVPFGQTDGMWVGNVAPVTYHEGGLGLEYVSIVRLYDGKPG